MKKKTFATAFVKVFSLYLIAAVCGVMSANATSTSKDYVRLSKLIGQGQAGKALEETREKLKHHPSDPQLLLLSGVALTQLGKVEDAIQIYKNMVLQTPELAAPYNNLAVIYASQGSLELAETELKMAITISPDFAQARQNLADVYIQLAAKSLKKAQLLSTDVNLFQRKIDALNALIAPVSTLPAAVTPLSPLLNKD